MKKDCPLKTNDINRMEDRVCDQSDCAWWDGLKIRCAIITIAENLKEFKEGIGDLDDMPAHQIWGSKDKR